MKMNKKAIAFKNFRRFKDFPKLELGNITYMVGRNNSGKSTMVKALLLITDYLQNQLSDTFAFDNEVLENANIVTFGRAKNNSSEEPLIDFEYQLKEFLFKISISGNDNNTKANVNLFHIKDLEKGITLSIDYLKGNINVSKEVVEDEEIDSKKIEVIERLEKAKKELENENKKITDKTSKEAIKLLNSLRTTNEKLKDAKKELPKKHKKKGDLEYVLDYPISLIINSKKENNYLDNGISKIVGDFIWINDIESRNKEKEKLSKNKLENILVLSRNTKYLTDFAKRLTSLVNEQYFYFIGANPSKQSALFYLRDKNNALAQAIHTYYQLTEGKEEKEETKRFVEKWMKRFEIGNKFTILMQGGEAYEFKIVEEGSSKEVSLSDKGMGSLQAMTLILKVASLTLLNKKMKKEITVLIEEPELNLHPALQSKLTDFFHEVYQEYEFNFILETHSEYMIRRSQLVALEKDYLSNQELDPNPFSVFYFHKEEGPYKMNYKTNGDFDKNFGKGFLDVVDNIALEIFLKNNSEN